MRATLALGEFMDIAGVALCDTARRGGESFDLRYAALTALERGGPTPEYLAVLRDLEANDKLGNWSERSEHRSLFAQNRGDTAVNLELVGKVAVLTGASKGIGRAITRAPVDEGVCMTAGEREFPEQSGDAARVHQVAVDLTTRDGPTRLVAETMSTFGALDILVNNVGAVHPRTQRSCRSPTMSGCRH